MLCSFLWIKQAARTCALYFYACCKICRKQRLKKTRVAAKAGAVSSTPAGVGLRPCVLAEPARSLTTLPRQARKRGPVSRFLRWSHREGRAPKRCSRLPLASVPHPRTAHWAFCVCVGFQNLGEACRILGTGYILVSPCFLLHYIT